MTLLLCSQRERSSVVMRDARGVYRLEGERPWAIEGPAALVQTALEDLGGVARLVHPEVIHLDFGNSVGVFRVRGLGTIEVVSGKWDESHFDSMLADVARIGSALPFAAGTAGPLPYDRTLSTRDDLLYHAYVYIRHILSDAAPRHVRLLPSLRAILAQPHSRAAHETVDVGAERVRRIDEATVIAIARGNGPLMQTRSAALPNALRGYLPRVLPEKRFRTSVDTPENRFVKAFLGLVTAVLARMRDVCGSDTGFSSRVRAECRRLEALVAPFVRHPLWRDVGMMVHLPAGSTVLQRRRGYREVFRHFVLLRLATRHLPISAHEARDLLEGKDIASLYEMWCYFRVVEVLRELLGEPVAVDMVASDHLQARLEREFEVRWPNGCRALYNATFSSKKARGRQTYSLPLRPDVVLVLPNGVVHVLDAKFKLEWMKNDEDDVERARMKLEDVYKMHAYRDAIDAARSAWVLYPGTEVHAFVPRCDSVDEWRVEGVGAIPLRPQEGGGSVLRRVLATMLAAGGGEASPRS